jgi:hypothetical protein
MALTLLIGALFAYSAPAAAVSALTFGWQEPMTSFYGNDVVGDISLGIRSPHRGGLAVEVGAFFSNTGTPSPLGETLVWISNTGSTDSDAMSVVHPSSGYQVVADYDFGLDDGSTAMAVGPHLYAGVGYANLVMMDLSYDSGGSETGSFVAASLVGESSSLYGVAGMGAELWTEKGVGLRASFLTTVFNTTLGLVTDIAQRTVSCQYRWDLVVRL